MSFINMMGNDVWSNADIAKRTDTMSLAAFPDRHILERDELFRGNGHVPGPPADSNPLAPPNENARFGQYVAHCQEMRRLFEEAVADMALLNEAMAVEEAMRMLETIPDTPENEEERAHYEEIIANASPEALELVEQRAAANAPPPDGGRDATGSR